MELFAKKALCNLKLVRFEHKMENLARAASMRSVKMTAATTTSTEDVSDNSGEDFNDFVSYMHSSPDSKKVVEYPLEKSSADGNI